MNIVLSITPAGQWQFVAGGPVGEPFPLQAFDDPAPMVRTTVCQVARVPYPFIIQSTGQQGMALDYLATYPDGTQVIIPASQIGQWAAAVAA